MFLVHKSQSFRVAFASLPSFHVRKMWLQGGTSGLLWSIGNFFSMISVRDLGEGVGYSVIQVRGSTTAAFRLSLCKRVM
jgi:glucose uptake protein GlcU